MAYIGGQLKEITFSHPTLGTGTLAPKSNEDSTYDLGGIRTDDEANGIAGDGTAIYKMNITRWSLEAVIANDMNVGLQLEKIVAMAGSPVEANWKITHINGSVYAGSGKVVGDAQMSGLNATFKLKIAGSNGLQKIV